MFRDDGHYYLNGVLIDRMTKAQCRDQGGLPSVTTKTGSWNDEGLIFWKIDENIQAAYAVLDGAIGVSLDDFRKLVAEEFYRTHNYIRLGTAIHDVLNKLAKQGIRNDIFMSWYREHCPPETAEFFESVQMAWSWYQEHVEQGMTELILCDKETGIAGTCDVNGLIISPDGEHLPGGVDWKCTYVKKHPGYRKSDGVMKSFGIKKDIKNQMQAGAYGRVLGWKGAYIVKISTNTLVPGIQAQWYSHEDLIKGYKMYAYIARAYDLINGFAT
jgi:hypothetical protein